MTDESKRMLMDWAERLAADIKYGPNTTGVFETQPHVCGKTHDLDPAKVKEFMDSLPLGLLKASKQ